MESRFILPIGTLAAGVVFGFVAGRGGGHAIPETHGTETRTVSRPAGPRQEHEAGESNKAAAGSSARVHGSSRIRDLQGIYAAMTSVQLAEAANALQSLPTAERLAETVLLYGAWAEIDPTGALAHAGAAGPAGEVARREALQGWAAYAPQAAADWFRQNKARFSPEVAPGGGSRSATERGTAAMVIGRALARHDVDAAILWATSLGTDASRAMESVLGEIARENPATAVRLAASNGKADNPGAREAIAASWGATDFGAARLWIRSLPEQQQDMLFSKALAALSVTDPVAAGKALDAMDDGAGKARGAGELMNHWATGDFHAAEQWLSSQKDESVRKAGLSTLVTRVAAVDPDAARSLVESAPPGDARDGAVAAYIRSSATAKPESMLEMVNEISNEADRWQSLAWIMGRWKSEDPQAAGEYLKRNFGELEGGAD